jgi:hypothetical protein
MMTPQDLAMLFNITLAMSFIAWGVVLHRYVWPALRDRPRGEAVRPLLILHCFRFVGLAFVMPGVVSPELPRAFARPAAFGDLASALLAMIAYAALPGRAGIALAWLFNIVGTLDLFVAVYNTIRLGIPQEPGLFGAGYFIPTVLVPLLLLTHALIFWLLLRKPKLPTAIR